MSLYPESLIYFMWKWQVHFMISCKVVAESLFNKIDSHLQATSFMIGYCIVETEERPAICFEPEKMEFLLPDLKSVNGLFESFRDNDPMRFMHYSGDGQQDEQDRLRYDKNFRNALKKALDDSPSFKDKIHFIAKPVRRDGYDVYIILQLNKSIYSNYQFLSYIDAEEILHKHLSFIEAVIDTYLEDRRHRLYIPEAGREIGPERAIEEILRTASTSFLFTIAAAGRSGHFHNLSPACNELCLYKYEGGENMGHLIVCKKQHPAIEITLEIDIPFSLEEHRKIRKLLELTSDEIGVVTNVDLVLGLGRRLECYDASKEEIFDVYFKGLHCYDVMHLDQPLLLMRYGNPEQVRHLINRVKFAEDASRVFDGISREQVDNLFILSMAAARGGKGCMLVFIKDAQVEARRMQRQCIAIKPKKMDVYLVEVLTSIDGALLIDLDGYAHAKGVILDGVIGIEGDASRGSRYNSALTYHEFRGWQKPTMIVVVSEDGMVDVIPQLRPKIRHSEIIQFIKTLESMNSAETFNAITFYNTMDLLQNRRFYLNSMECDQLNELAASLHNFDLHSGKTVWRTFDKFTPNARMNESYYVPE